ncbi:hypothetical protein PanWU01x14_051810 [Parasponia andersonii]|uniref:Uncharacterized protein n=1 Tax=Parasponia andersonii TaxID=3476 RepID=A0A2P5DM27_PARAD|nr:hypothetical protein PanWU01x14_051810 [Parasponia andersonii]
MFEWFFGFSSKHERAVILKNLKDGGEKLVAEVEKLNANDMTKWSWYSFWILRQNKGLLQMT